MFSANGTAWSRFVTITIPFFRSEVRWKALGLLALLILLLLSVSGLNVVNSFVGRDFITAIAERRAARYYPLAFMYLGVFAASTVVAVFYGFTEGRLGLLWREWLTKRLIDRYLAHQVYYRLNQRDDIDNPDQRISEDVRNFTVTTLSFLLMILNSTITVIAFLGILWSITPWLVVVAIGYSAFGSLMTVVLGHRLVGLHNLQFKKEADLRFTLVHVREFSEPIAYLGSEKAMKSRLGKRLQQVVHNFKTIIAVNRNLGFFTTGYNYLVPFIPLFIAGPLYIRGVVEFGVVTQSAMAFAQVVGAFSLIVVQFESISTFAAVVARLGSLWDAIEGIGVFARTGIKVLGDESQVAYEHLSIRTPEGKTLIRDLTIQVPVGKRLFITGPNGAGKTALFRATLGIWEEGQGWVARPRGHELIFLPQRAYTLPGTFRDQLICSDVEREVTDKELVSALRQFHLESVLDRVGGLDVERDWANILSMGEQQLLAFARLFVLRPRFAFLDDATNALSEPLAHQAYDLLSQSSITYISMADEEDLRSYHDAFLELHEDGSWREGVIRRAEAAVRSR
jgi:putative ATP-binding cassette transporter